MSACEVLSVPKVEAKKVAQVKSVKPIQTQHKTPSLALIKDEASWIRYAVSRCLDETDERISAIIRDQKYRLNTLEWMLSCSIDKIQEYKKKYNISDDDDDDQIEITKLTRDNRLEVL